MKSMPFLGIHILMRWYYIFYYALKTKFDTTRGKRTGSDQNDKPICFFGAVSGFPPFLAWVNISWELGSAQLLMWSRPKSICTPEMDSTRINRSLKTMASFHMISWKYLIHPNTPIMVGWTIGEGCTRNQALGRSPILSIIPALGGLTFECPCNAG